MTKAYAQGFSSQHSEISISELPIHGQFPTWLRGTLIRNGPGQFEVGKTPIPHWFDGLAQLHRFSFGDGKVSYGNRFIRSNAYAKDNQTGKINYRGFAVDPCRTMFQKAFALFIEQEPANNTVVNITRLEDDFIAMTEFPLAVRFDPHTLETLGVLDYDEKVNAQLATAHPHYDFARRVGINHMTRIGRKMNYDLYALTSKKRTKLASVTVKSPSYMHSFSTTPRYIILADYSFKLKSLIQLAFGDKPFIQNFVWDDTEDSHFLVIDIERGKLVAEVPTDPFFCFHHINAYEADDNTLIVDLSAYDDAHLIDQLYVDALLQQDYPQVGEFRRYTVPLNGGRASYEVLSDESIELPRINYKPHNGRDYQFAYGASVQKGTSDFLNQIVKVDVKNRQTSVWYEEGCYPSEPVFVPAPNAQAEDDGVLLVVVLDSRAGNSFMLALDAQSMQELGRAIVPQHIPFGFHGSFFDI
ncbi:MAG: carotenoid oxygenase family protein [Anaerolineae bacterium]|nr:carotenoid oxygenase family protein [Anaerolineae bacterium]